ncbi:hypothetical protein, partial [Nocardia caishijiensis]
MQGCEHPAETFDQLPNLSICQPRMLTSPSLQGREPVRRDLSLGLRLSGPTCDSDRISASVERITIPGQLSVEIADQPSCCLEFARLVRLGALHGCQRDIDLFWVEDLSQPVVEGDCCTIFGNDNTTNYYDQIAWFSTPEDHSLLTDLTYTQRAGHFDF